MPTITVEIEARPQFVPILEGTSRFSVVIAHRRCGKTVMAVQALIKKALTNPLPDTRCTYIAPLRNQAKSVAWDLLKRMTHALPDRQVNEAELRVDFHNGARISLLGADNPDSIRGQYSDLTVMDEVDQMPPDTWTYVVRPLLADRKGSAIFIGTPAGKQLLHELWEAAPQDSNWSRYMFKASETGLVAQEELDAALQQMGQDAYDQEFECSFTAAIRGAYYGRVMEEIERAGHMQPIDRDPAVRLVTGWDLGTRDATAIWVMQPYRGNAWAAIDYYEATGQGVDHYAGWLDDHGYLSGSRHIAPHDIAYTDFGIAGGLNRKEVAAQHGIRFERVPRAKNSAEVMEGIQAVRTMLPRMYFHSAPDERGNRVYQGRHALSLYRQGYNERLSALQANPIHDWTSHAADAMRAFVAVRDSDKRELPSELWDRDIDINNARGRDGSRARPVKGYSRGSGPRGRGARRTSR